jgi:hypothetical protein
MGTIATGRTSRNSLKAKFAEHLAGELRRKGPTASLMRNALLSTSLRAHIGQRKGYEDARDTPEGSHKRANIDVAERDNAK